MDKILLNFRNLLVSGILFLSFLFIPNLYVMAQVQDSIFFSDSAYSQISSPTLNDSLSKPTKIPNNIFFGVGSGSSFGATGFKLGKFKAKKNYLIADYIIAGIGSYRHSSNSEIALLAAVGRRYYLPYVFYIDGRAGINDYTYNSGSLSPVLGVKLIAGFEIRVNRVGFTMGAGVSQNLLFDQTTRPFIEAGFIFGKWDVPEKKNQE